MHNYLIIIYNNSIYDNMQSICQTFSSFDVLSPEPCLYINSQHKFIALRGILLSVFLFFCFLAIILYFFIDFLLGSGMTIIYSKEETSEDFSFNLNNKLFAFNFVSLTTGEVNKRIATIVPVFWLYNGTYQNVIEIPVVRCSYNENFTKEKYENVLKNRDITAMKCLSTSEIDFL